MTHEAKKEPPEHRSPHEADVQGIATKLLEAVASVKAHGKKHPRQWWHELQSKVATISADVQHGVRNQAQ